MIDQRKTEIKVGVTVILGIIVFLLIFGWSRNVSIFSDRIILNIEFDTVAGLETGDPVTINGVRKGFVESIIIDDMYPIVKISLEKDSDIRVDAEFMLMMLDLMGGKKIEIMKGFSSEKIDKNLIQKGKFSGDISYTLSSLNDVQTEVLHIIKQTDITLTSINKIINDEDFSNNVKESLANMADISESLNDLMSRNINNFNILIANATELLSASNDFFKENKDSLSNVLSNMNILVNNSNDLVIRIDNILTELKSQDNNLGKFVYDEKLFIDFKNLLNSANQTMEILNTQLKGDGVNVRTKVNLFD